MRRLVLWLFVAAVAIGGGMGAAAWWDFTRPGPLTEAGNLVIPKGAGIKQISRLLEERGVVRHGRAFEIGVRLGEDAALIRAGEYAFEPAVSVRDVVEKLIAGETVVRRFTLPEGLTTADAMRRLNETEGLVGDTPSAPEGRLMPDTYHFTWGDSRAEIVQRMRKAMDDAIDRAWRLRKPDLPLTSPQQLLTLASVVEKETGVAAERSRVAAVFLNRLNRGMKLQSDPTVIYAITEGKQPHERALSRQDLEVESPYNTYRVEGLPPGPIANPGAAALLAVVTPADTDALYFVADGSGGHAFSRTLDEHNRNVQKWRRVQRERDAAARAPTEPAAAGDKAP